MYAKLDNPKILSDVIGVISELVTEVKLRFDDKGMSIITLDIIDKIKRSFLLALIEIESEDKTIPSLEFLSQIQMNPQDLVDAVEDCLIVSDSCSFIAEPDKFVIEASGLNSARAEFSSDEVKI